MDLEFSGEMWFWKGPSPFHFVTVPDEECEDLAATAAAVTYGWGMIPVAGTHRGDRLDDVVVAQGRSGTSCRSRRGSGRPKASSWVTWSRSA